MEFFEGRTLKQVITSDGAFSEERTVQIITQVAAGLSAAHQNGVIHRDIKSDNIMLTPAGQVKIMDFGLAKMEQMPTITRTKSPMGTVGYMSPELIKGEKVDLRTDLWSLGVVLFKILIGRLPFEKESDVATMRAIVESQRPKFANFKNRMSRTMQYLLMNLLEKDLSLRWNSADQILQEVNKKRGKSSIRFAVRKLRRNYKKISLIIAVILLVVYLGNYYYQTQINIPGWLKNSAVSVPIANEAQEEFGSLSPDGQQLVYEIIKDNTYRLCVKTLSDNSVKKIAESDTHSLKSPIWSPDELNIAYIRDWISIWRYNLQVDKHYLIWENPDVDILNIDWSPDSKRIDFRYIAGKGKDFSSAIDMIDIFGENRKNIYTVRYPKMLVHLAFFPDCQHIAFSEFDFDQQVKTIYSLDLNLAAVTSPIIKLNYKEKGYL